VKLERSFQSGTPKSLIRARYLSKRVLPAKRPARLVARHGPARGGLRILGNLKEALELYFEDAPIPAETDVITAPIQVLVA